MEYQPSGQISCGFKGSGGYAELIAGPRVNDGQWHTVRCVKTSSSIQVVVDGQTFSKTATLGSIANSASVVIGARVPAPSPGARWTTPASGSGSPPADRSDASLGSRF